jgi:hypothetical protein
MPPAWHKAPSVTKAFEWREGCTGKRGFPSQQVAIELMLIAQAQKGSAYKCRHCHMWHWTRKKPER